jgi:4-amino-4-deoxy-L-arabinose transferase-like glycosyltransferase
MRNHGLILFFTTYFCLFYYSWNINSWQFSFVGDEWPFYLFARAIVDYNFLLNPFDFHGVFLQNTVLSSMYQALFLQVFGFSNFAWRLSNILLIIPITIFFYLWTKRLFQKDVALFSTIFLQCSFYLANFLKIGKNMPQALALLTACLYLATRCADKPSKKNFFLLGILLGLSFYIYIGPIFPLFIAPLLLPLLKTPKKKQLIIQISFLVLGYVILLFPALLDFAEWSGPASKTFFHKEYSGYGQVFENIFHNFLLFYRNYDYLFNHYVTGPYFDIISRFFVFVGTIIMIVKIRKRPYFLAFLSYISICVIIGITSPYIYAPTTRGIFFLPFGALFAGIGLNWIILLLKKPHIKHFFPQWMRANIIKTGIIVLLFLAIFLLNLYQSQIGVFKESGYSATALLMKEIQEAQKNHDTKNIGLLVSNDNPYYAYLFFPAFRDAYQITDVFFFMIKAGALDCSSIKDTNILLFKTDKEALTAYKKLPCPKKPIPTILSPQIPY